MEVYSGSHKSIQLNLWQIYFFSFKICSYENISPVRHVYEFGISLRWDSALHFKFAQRVFTTVFYTCFQRVNIPWAEHYALDPVKCFSAFVYCVLQHTWVILSLSGFAPLASTEYPRTPYPDTEMFAYYTSAGFGDYLQRFRVFKFLDFWERQPSVILGNKPLLWNQEKCFPLTPMLFMS